MVRGSFNIYKKLSGTLSVREGQKRRGVANPIESPVSSEYVWNTSYGATYPFWVTDSKLQVEVNGIWYTLLDSLTTFRYVFDKWWDNTEKKDRVLFVHGNSDIQHWSGGFATVAAQVAGGSTLTTANASLWIQNGFASNTAGEKKFKINGSATEYTYTGGETTATLTGITPALPVINANDIVIQSVITETNKPAAGFNNDFIKVINNQVYVGSYTSRLCYISKNTDFKDYVVPTPRAPGDPELLTLDATLNGISVRQGNAYISFGTDSWAAIIFNDVTVGTTLTQTTKVDIKPVAVGQAAYAHEFIDSVGDNIVYLAKDQQVRVVGDYNNAFTPRYPSFSQEICTELFEETFTGGGLRCIGEFIYITAPVSGKVYLRQERESVNSDGQVVAERLWHAPFIWNATRIDSINGVVYAFSNANPQLYQVWDTDQWYDDSPSDEPLPYSCVLAFAYRTANRRQGLLNFDKNFVEGYLTAGTPLNFQINYDFEGSTNQTIGVVNSVEQPAKVFQPSQASLGDSSLGDESLGDGITEDAVVKFKEINSLSLVDCFEYQPIFFSDTANARWEILATGTNARVSTNDATFIINKRR